MAHARGRVACRRRPRDRPASRAAAARVWASACDSRAGGRGEHGPAGEHARGHREPPALQPPARGAPAQPARSRRRPARRAAATGRTNRHASARRPRDRRARAPAGSGGSARGGGGASPSSPSASSGSSSASSAAAPRAGAAAGTASARRPAPWRSRSPRRAASRARTAGAAAPRPRVTARMRGHRQRHLAALHEPAADPQAVALAGDAEPGEGDDRAEHRQQPGEHEQRRAAASTQLAGAVREQPGRLLAVGRGRRPRPSNIWPRPASTGRITPIWPEVSAAASSPPRPSRRSGTASRSDGSESGRRAATARADAPAPRRPSASSTISPPAPPPPVCTLTDCTPNSRCTGPCCVSSACTRAIGTSVSLTDSQPRRRWITSSRRS